MLLSTCHTVGTFWWVSMWGDNVPTCLSPDSLSLKRPFPSPTPDQPAGPNCPNPKSLSGPPSAAVLVHLGLRTVPASPELWQSSSPSSHRHRNPCEATGAKGSER